MATQEQPTKLTQEELIKLTEIQNSRKNITSELGNISIIEINLETRKQYAIKALSELSSQENLLAKSLEDKYGKGTVDISSGTFIPL